MQRRGPEVLLRLDGFEGPLNPLATSPGDEYPIVACTFRLTEHYLSGPMSRFNSWLNELQPEMFVELSPELATERGIEHGGWLTVVSPRGQIAARALVTRRLQQLGVDVIEAPHDLIGTRLIDAYMAIKRKGAIG